MKTGPPAMFIFLEDDKGVTKIVRGNLHVRLLHLLIPSDEKLYETSCNAYWFRINAFSLH